MIYILYGVLGVLLTLILFAGGALLGWKAHKVYLEKTKTAIQTELTEQQKREAKEAAKAFDVLVNYNPDVAYGLTSIKTSDEE